MTSGPPAPPARHRHRTAWATLLVVLAIVVPVLFVGFASVAYEPVDPLSVAGAPDHALPARPASSVALPTIEPFPIVDPTTPRPALDDYGRLVPGDLDAARTMFDDAAAQLRAPSLTYAAIQIYLRDLLYAGPLSEAELGKDQFTSVDFEQMASIAMDGLAQDDANATHLDDMAVALTVLADDLARVPDALDQPGGYNDPERMQAGAIRLLQDTVTAFPDDRTARLNLAFLQDLLVGQRKGTATPIADLHAFVDTHPSDVTARILLASLESRRWDRDGLDAALDVAAGITGDASMDPLRHVVIGDALVASADRAGDEAPRLRRQRAERAIREYDAALSMSWDRAALAGRAIALDLVGDLDAAVDAQREATGLDASSVPQQLRLVMLEGCAGMDEARRRDAEALLAVLRADAGTTPGATLLSGTRPGPRVSDFTNDLGVDRGLFGIGLGSDRVPWALVGPSGRGGGGYLIDGGGLLAEPPCLGSDPDDAEQVALTEALEASVALGDPVTADQDAQAYTARQDPEQDLTWVTDYVDQARAVAAGAAGSPLDEAHACRTQVEAITIDAGDLDTSENDTLEGLGCVLRKAREADDGDDVEWAITAIPTWALDWDPGAAVLVLAGDVRREQGQLAEAQRFYRWVSQSQSMFVPAMLRLGEMALDRGDGAGGRVLYDLAITATESGYSDQDFDRSRNLRLLAQVAHNNRGIATLMQVPKGQDGAPDCTTATVDCTAALDDFLAAAGSDPGNATYWMNIGWVHRLQGDDLEAEAALHRALEMDSSLAPALNDLGVLEARRGDAVSAREHLRRAIAIDPSYDLATWDLGVLESGTGPVGLFAGQRWLATGLRLGTELSAEQLSYRTDERIYRVVVRPGGSTVLERARTPATGALVFASIAAAGGLAKVLDSLRGPVHDAGEKTLREGLPAGRRQRITRRLRALTPDPIRGWVVRLSWLPLTVLLALGAWTNSIAVAGDATVAGFVLLAAAAVLAIFCHIAGHRAVGHPDLQVRPTGWWPGLFIGLLAIPLQVATAPYPVERSNGTKSAWRAALAGPGANLLAAVVAYVLFASVPMPWLRTLAQVQLAVAAYTLLPVEPFDGSVIAAARPGRHAILSLVVVAAAAAFAARVI